ncbi:MAG: AAA family ATPase [Phycisphaeraceae bacterium]|nr:MAG: AAA family ATPase [Phycisphaeraceae bacterium]
MRHVEHLSLRSYKAIKSLDINLDDLTVIVGINGSGKSSLLSFFQMLGFMQTGAFQSEFVQQRCGGASKVLHHGPSVSRIIEASMTLRADQGTNQYSFSIAHAAGDSFVFTDERVSFKRTGSTQPEAEHSLGAGHRESSLRSASEDGVKPAGVVRWLLNGCRAFQFHDTSLTSPLRQNCSVNDNVTLKSNGGNLPAVLLAIRDGYPDVYKEIRRHLRAAIPQFDDFVLTPMGLDRRSIRLRWKETSVSTEFDVDQASDGTLRLMALVTLLLQPLEHRPKFMVIDEPELGLHPLALHVLSGLLRGATEKCQVLMATQSMPLVQDLIDATGLNPVVAESVGGQTTMKRLSPLSLDQWLDSFSVGSQWSNS